MRVMSHYGDDEPRRALQRLIEERGEDYAGLSRLLGRNPAYIQQYIKRGSPRRLAEEDRRLLARYFGVDEALLGGPPAEAGTSGLRPVPRLDVGAAAGAGAFDGDESGARPYRLRSGLAAAARARRARTSCRSSASTGDSMAPTLADGDDILVDRGDGARAAARRHLCAEDRRRAGGEAARAQSGGARPSRSAATIPLIPAGPIAIPARSTSSAGWSGPGGGSAEAKLEHHSGDGLVAISRSGWVVLRT